MELKKTEKKIKCDVAGCKNMANYCLSIKKNFLLGNMYFCLNCLNNFYKVIGCVLTPPSIKNIYKKDKEK
jgi:hypothetical protein